MPLKATSLRRQIIVGTLFGLALIGGAIRYYAPNPSLTRDMGNLLLVLWVPAIGNVIAFVVRKVRERAPSARAFATGQHFSPQLSVEMTPLAPQLRTALGRLDPRQDHCTLVLGSDGFTARISEPLGRWLSRGQAQSLQLEFLRPALALPRFSAGTGFRILAGTTVVGEGRVLALLG